MLLTTMPGIGYHNALLIVSEVGDIERFPDALHLASYAGLVPSVYASAGKVRYGRITKAGSRWLRWALVQSAHVAARQPGALRNRFEQTARRKGRKVAMIALARFMLKTVYHLLKEQQPYREDAGSSRCDMAL
jgi:transposase